MIQEVINNITDAENEAEDMLRIASQQAKDIKLRAEYECELIRKRASESVKEATKLRSTNAEVAAKKKTEQIFKDGNREIADFVEKCSKNTDEAVKVVTRRLIAKYGDN